MPAIAIAPRTAVTKSAPQTAATTPFDAFRQLFDQNDLIAAERLAPQLSAGDPNRAIDVLTRLGLLRRRHGQVGPAIEAFLEAAKLANAVNEPTTRLPDWLQSELSGCYLQQQDWPSALAAAEAGLAAKPMLALTAAIALVHLARLAEARDRIWQAVLTLAPDPARAAAAAAACTTLLFADQSPETQSVLTATVAAWPESPYFQDLRASLAALQAGSGTAPGNAIAMAEAAVLAAPDSEPALFRLRDALAGTNTLDQVADALADLQARTSVVLPALLVYLSRQMPMRNILARFAAQIDDWQHSAAVADCTAYLDAVCHFTDPAPAVIDRLLALPETQLRLFVLLRQPRPRIIRLRNPTTAEQVLLQEAQLDIAATQSFLAGLVGNLEPEWAAYLDQAAFASTDAEQIVRADEGFAAFQDRIIRDQAFPMIDPAGGGPADLFDSVKIHDRQVFAFRGTELLTFHTGGNMNFALFIHLVRRNLILQVDTSANPSKQGFYAADAYMAEVQAVWLRRAARNHAALLQAAAAAPTARGTRRRIVAIHGRAENPAHHIWNYLPPFERLALAGTLGNIETILAPPTHYFGNLPDLFPELAATEIIEMPEAAAIDPCPFSPQHIALQLGSSFIPSSLMQRIRGWAERTVDPVRRQTIERLTKRRPVIWIGLRVGDKVWVNQTAGVARMIDLITPLYPEALFLLDGFSLPDDAPAIPAKWRAAAAALETVAAEVQQATAYPASVHSLVGNRISESVLWAQAADVYFTPLGSSQHKVGWYGSAPGLVYTSAKLAKHPPARRQGSWEAEAAPVPNFLIGQVAAPGQRRGNHDYRTNLENLDFEPHLAARRLLALLVASDLTPPASHGGCYP